MAATSLSRCTLYPQFGTSRLNCIERVLRTRFNGGHLNRPSIWPQCLSFDWNCGLACLFEARIGIELPTSLSNIEETVEMLGDEADTLVRVRWPKRKLAVLRSQLVPLINGEATNQAFAARHYRVRPASTGS